MKVSAVAAVEGLWKALLNKEFLLEWKFWDRNMKNKRLISVKRVKGSRSTLKG